MTMRPRLHPFTLLLFATVVAALVAGCRGASTSAKSPAPKPTATCEGPPPEPEPEVNEKLAPYTGPMVIVQPSAMLGDLERAGLDPKNLPRWEAIDKKTKQRIMKTFASSLGLKCIGCHDLDDFAKSSPRKRATARMWNDFVRVLTLEDGSPAYCDSCHQGSVQVLDRRNKALVSSFMDDVLVGKMKRRDGKDHECGTCHGDPPEFAFLKEWRAAK